MKALTSLLLTLVFAGLAWGQSEKEEKKPLFGDAATAETYKHASDTDLQIYRFDPPNFDPSNERRPATVFFFGGGWNGGTVTQFEQHAKYLASRGMVTFVADYRVKSRQQVDPNACVADAKSAVRWIRTHSKRLGINPDRIAAGGGSAGGHIAAVSGMCEGLEDPAEAESEISSRPNALLLFNPVYNNGPDGFSHERVKEWFPAISPAHNISADDPPTIVFFGTDDKLVSVELIKEFEANMQEAGVTSELHLYEGMPHGFFNERKSKESFLDTVLKMDAFLVSLNWLEGEADEEKLNSLLRGKRKKKNKKAK